MYEYKAHSSNETMKKTELTIGNELIQKTIIPPFSYPVYNRSMKALN